MRIKVDLHTHTLVSQHAYSTAKENAVAAYEYGLEGLAITDHGPGFADGAREIHFDTLDLINRVVNNVVVLRGVECSFADETGALDLKENHYKNIDIIIASVHGVVYSPKTKNEHTAMLLRAMDNPYIDIFGHIARNKCGADYDLVCEKAKKCNKLIELNEHTLTGGSAEWAYPNAVELMKSCKKYGTQIVVNTDAHFCDRIGKVENSLELLNDIDFDENLIVNTSLNKVLDYLKQKRNIIL